MKVKATISFTGQFSMNAGEVKECSNKAILQDLIKSGYVEKIEEVKNKKKVVTNEN